MPKRQTFTVTQVVAVKNKPYAIYETRIWASGAPEAIRRARLGLAPCWRLIDRWGQALSTFLHYTCDDAYELYDEQAKKDHSGPNTPDAEDHRNLVESIRFAIARKNDSLFVVRSFPQMRYLVERTTEILSEKHLGFGVHCGSSITFGPLGYSHLNSISFTVVAGSNDESYKQRIGRKFDYVSIVDATGLSEKQTSWILGLATKGGPK